MAANDEDEILTVAEVAAELKVTPTYVGKLIASGRLVASRIGFGKKRPRKRIMRAELARFMAASEPKGRTDPPAPRRKGKLPKVPEYV